MTRKVIINFDEIHSYASFYRQCKDQFSLPQHFGNNLDALWDVITGYIALPVEVEFTNVSSPQLKKFNRHISLFKEAQQELEGMLQFSIATK